MKKKQVALVTVICGLTILGIKLVSFFISNSMALLSDALESIVNIAASVLMFFSVSISERVPDRGHKYGHQKIEDISSLLEGLLIIAAALLIIIAAAERLFEPVKLVELDLAIGISMVATALNGGLSWLLASSARQYESTALEGDAKHLFSDVISTIGVWLGLIFAQLTGWSFLDSILAFIIAALIGNIGARLVLNASNLLMDQSCVEEENMRASDN
jgi:cation diffusion facilitator family transporter